MASNGDNINWRALEAMYDRVEDEHKQCRVGFHFYPLPGMNKEFDKFCRDNQVGYYWINTGMGRTNVLHKVCYNCGGLLDEYYYVNGQLAYRRPRPARGYILSRTDRERDENIRLSTAKNRAIEMRRRNRDKKLIEWPFDY